MAFVFRFDPLDTCIVDPPGRTSRPLFYYLVKKTHTHTHAHTHRRRVLIAFFCRWKAAPPPRRLLRPKLFILLGMRRRGLLHKTFTAWALLMQQRGVDRGFARRRGVRLLRLLRRRESRLAAAGIERWREAVRATRRLERTRAACFERWRLFVLLRRVCVWHVVCALHIEPFFLPVDIHPAHPSVRADFPL